MNDALFVDTPAPEASLFTDEPAPEGKSLAGFGKNAWQDVKNTAGSLASLAQGVGEHPMDTMAAVAKGIPSAIVGEGKRLGVGELLTGHPMNALEKFAEAGYEKPLTTALDLLPAEGEATKVLGIGGEAAKGAEIAADAAKAAPTAATAAAEEAGIIPIERAIGQAGKITPKIVPPEPPLPSPGPSTGVIDELRNYIGPKAKTAQNAVNSQYAKQAGRQGWATDVADYLQEKSQMMANQQMGATPLQARQVGHEGMRGIGQYALDNDLVSPTTGLRGMRVKNSELLKAAGQKLDAFRNQADSLRDPVAMPVDVLQEVRSRLDPLYARGAKSGEAGQYAKALEDVEDAKPTFSGMADTATKLNKVANEANRLKQPHGAFTDVANTISEINNERIKQLLGPQKAAEYEQALREYGVNKKISGFLERKAAGEVKRFGPGSATSNLFQKAMDEIGYRAGAKVTNRLSSAVLKNPSMAKSLPSMFKEFIHQVEDVSNEGLASGGIVGADELNNFLAAKYEKKENQ